MRVQQDGAVKLTIVLNALDCASCGVIFAITDEFEDQRRGDGRSFHCPNGHSMSYGSGDKERIRSLETQLRNANGDAMFYRSNMEAAERSLRATKGVVTKLRKRAEAGVCPFGCRRHFADVQRHVASQHAGQTLEGEA